MNCPVYAPQEIMDAFEVSTGPYTLMYDQDGDIAHVHDALLDRKTLVEMINGLLANSH